MRNLLRDLRSAWWHLVHPQPWPEPDEDDVSPAARRQWVAGHKHPAACASGCQCDLRGSLEPHGFHVWGNNEYVCDGDER